MIRPAKFGEIHLLVSMWKAAHARSEKYKRLTFDDRQAQKLLFNAIKNHGAPHAGGTWAMIYEKDGWVHGFLFGVLDRIGDVGEELYATDWKFICDPAADARAALLLRDSFLAWARANDRVREIVVGVHDALGDYQRTAQIWKQKGLQEMGLMLGQMIEREAARSVA